MRSGIASFVVTCLLAAAGTAQDKVRPGPWQTASKVPEGWLVFNTKNYHIQSQCGLDKAKRLGEHMEVMNVVYRRMFKPDKDGAKQQTIKLFKDEAGFHAYGAPGGAAAYYSPGEREMVCYDTGKWMDDPKAPATTTGTGAPDKLEALRRRLGRFEDAMKMDLLGCAAHEGWHQYFHWLVVSRVELPSWINEGMGDYFYTAAPKDGRSKKADLGKLFDGRLMILQEAKRQNAMVPLEQFLQMLQQDYYSNPSICYAQGWAFCQFLLHGADGKYAKIIPGYVKGLCNDTNWKEVQAKSFKGFDVAAMEKEFKTFVDGLKPSVEDPFQAGSEPEEGDPATPPVPPNGGGNGGPGGNGD